MDDLFAGLDGLSLRRRSLRQASIEAKLIQQGVFDVPGKNKPMRLAKANRPSGKPRAGVIPKTGARLIDISLEDEWKKRKRAAASSGGAAVPKTSRSTVPTPAARFPVAGKNPTDMLRARVKVASGSQAAVVKIASYAAGGARVNALIQYQGRNGKLTLEREDGSKIEGAENLAALARAWTSDEPAREPSNDVLRLVVDIGGSEFRGRGGKVQIQSALCLALPGHRFAFAAEDQPDGSTRVEIVMSAAARRQGDEAKAARIFNNRKSLAQLKGRFDRAFRTETKIDVRGFAHGVEGTARYLTQLTRGGSRPLHSMRLHRDGSFSTATTLIGHDANLRQAKDWKRDLRSREQRDVAHIILSARPGTDRQAFVDAARAMLAKEFAGHEYAFALHEDREHIHIHAVIKMRAETGERLDPKIEDLKRYREILAHEARERHIPMEAVSRFERSNPPGYKLKDIRRVERGVAPESMRRRVEAVRSGTLHIPVREEGKKRARAVLQGWRDVEAIATSRSFEPALAAGAARLYRADRPGAQATTAPLFTRDRAAATNIAARSGGTVSYIDVSPAEFARLKPSRSDVRDQFVVAPELAAMRKPLDQPSTAMILAFKSRAEQAVAGAAQLAASRQSTTTGVIIDMPNLETMQLAFDDINEQMKVVEETLPVELLPQMATARTKMNETQQKMLKAQANIERKRGAVEGGRFVEPVIKDIAGFVAERRGETVRYSHVAGDGQIGKIAFVDNGKKVEIHDWKDRTSVLAAMRVSAEKWGDLTVTGTASYKALVVELAAEHGFEIANPELQDQIRRETARLERVRRERPGFTAGDGEKEPRPTQMSESSALQPAALAKDDPKAEQARHETKEKAAHAKPLLTEAEIAIGREQVRTLVENEAARETRRANISSVAQERPFEGGGEDHAYRTQAEAGAARRAQDAVQSYPKHQMPIDIKRSPEVERLAGDQAELLKKRQDLQKFESEQGRQRQKQ